MKIGCWGRPVFHVASEILRRLKVCGRNMALEGPVFYVRVVRQEPAGWWEVLGEIRHMKISESVSLAVWMQRVRNRKGDLGVAEATGKRLSC